MISLEEDKAFGEFTLNLAGLDEVRQIHVDNINNEIQICHGPYYKYELSIYDLEGNLKDSKLNIAAIAFSSDGTLEALSSD